MKRTTWVLKILSSQSGHWDGLWLKAADVDAHDGRGEASGTRDLALAMRFASVDEAMECWRKQSTVRPLRPDGKPNRPLTAFTVACERVEEEVN